MRIIITPLVLVTLFLMSCTKPDVLPSAPLENADLSRSLVFPNRNGETKSAIYFGRERVGVRAQFQDGGLSITINALPQTNNATGESLVFKLNAANIASTLIKTYAFNDPTGGILSCRYVYMKKDGNGDAWASFTDSQTGVRFDGSFKIEKFDPVHQLISGSYQIFVNGLINDPTKESVGIPIDPLNKCDLMVMGAFSNQKIR